jgi:very-short-patch-repair endonuclease
MKSDIPTLNVDWNSGELRPAPRKSNPNRRETFYPATCFQCGNVRWLRKSDAKKGCKCRHCQTSEAGKLGYRQTVNLYGSDFAIKALQSYRLEHPSRPEQKVTEYLSGRHITFEREFRIDMQSRSYLLDFVLLEGDQVIAGIEVDGWHHRNRDASIARDTRLNSEIPFPLLRLDADSLELDRIEFLLWQTI